MARNLVNLIESPEWELLSKETTKALMKKSLELLASAESDHDALVLISDPAFH